MPTEDEKRPDPPGESAGDDEKSVRTRLEGFIPDLVKKTFYAGLGAVFTTEEGIRKIANEFSLPKDVANYLINSAASTKEELFRIVGKEMREFLNGLNLNQEMAKLLTQLSFEIKTEIRFIPNDEAVGGVKPDIKKKVALKRTKPDNASGTSGVGGTEGNGEPDGGAGPGTAS